MRPQQNKPDITVRIFHRTCFTIVLILLHFTHNAIIHIKAGPAEVTMQILQYCRCCARNSPQTIGCPAQNDRNTESVSTVYPKKYAHGFCFAVLCCGYTLTDFPISIRLTSLALGQSNDCPSASKATLMNMDKYFMWIHYERLHNHNKAKHSKTVCIFLGIYCMSWRHHALYECTHTKSV